MPDLHPGIAALAPLLGTWSGAGRGDYPTIQPFRYLEEITFGHIGKPFLAYTQRTRSEAGQALHAETGYLRMPSPQRIELVLAHPTGITEIYVGTIEGTKIEMITDAVVRTASAKEVTAGKRLYGLIGADLGYAYDLAAVGQPLQPHVSAQLKRVGDGLTG